MKQEASRRGLKTEGQAKPIEPITLADLHVQDKQTKAIVPLLSVLNKPQRDVLTELGIDPEKPLPDLSQTLWRMRILKARREGISTIIAAIYFCDTYNHKERNTVEMAHNEDSAGEIFELYRRFYMHLPAEKKRKAQKQGAGELYWADTNSSISVATAGSMDVKSGATIHNLHKSEYAKWTGDIAAIDASVNIATQYGNIIEETTAKGLNHFYDKWQESKQNKSRYKAYFLPWFADPANVSPVPYDFERTDEEENRVATFGLSDAQLQWYREQKAEYRELTAQEFPHTAREAFVSSGNKVFRMDVLEIWEQRQKQQPDPLRQVEFAKRGERFQFWNRLRDQYAAGNLTVWELPGERLHSLVTADPAGGIDRDGNADMCSASAWVFSDMRPLEQVAHLYGRWEPEEFAWICAELAYWYNAAMLCPLSLNHGQSMWNTLVNTVHYPQGRGGGWGGLYYHNPAEVNERVKDLHPDLRTPGFPEGGGGKEFLVGCAQTYVREDRVIVNSPITLAQLFRYVHLAGGSMGAESGHDDAVSDFYCAAGVYRLRGKYARLLPEVEEDEPVYHGWGSGRRGR